MGNYFGWFGPQKSQIGHLNPIQFQTKMIFIWLIQCNHEGQGPRPLTAVLLFTMLVGMEALQKVMSESLAPR